MSTKGQIVIPEIVRRGIEVGTPFVVSRENGLIVLKEVEGLTKAEMDEMAELDKIWRDVDSGNCESYSVEEFFKQMKKW